jgi:hypothetical protein
MCACVANERCWRSTRARDFSLTGRLISASAVVFGLAATLGAQVQPPTFGPVARDGRDWIQQENGVIERSSRLRISFGGTVRIDGRPSDDIEYRVMRRVRANSEAEARELFEQARLAVSRSGPTATLALAEPPCVRCGFVADLAIAVPNSLQEAIVGAGAGDIHVSGIEGRVNADSAGGSIELDVIGGSVRATAAGPIALGSIGGEVRCQTAGGSISVQVARGDATLTTSGGAITVGEVGGALRAETAGGDVRAARVGGLVAAATSGGSIAIGQAGGTVNVETAGGSIEVAFAPRGVRAETAGGHIRLRDVAGRVQAASAAGDIQAFFLDGAPAGDSVLETNVGTIVVWLPAGARMAVDATVEFGKSLDRIRSDFDTIRAVRHGDGLGVQSVRAQGALNGGGPLLRIRNTNGRIEIRRRP